MAIWKILTSQIDAKEMAISVKTAAPFERIKAVAYFFNGMVDRSPQQARRIFRLAVEILPMISLRHLKRSDQRRLISKYIPESLLLLHRFLSIVAIPLMMCCNFWKLAGVYWQISNFKSDPISPISKAYTPTSLSCLRACGFNWIDHKEWWLPGHWSVCGTLRSAQLLTPLG